MIIDHIGVIYEGVWQDELVTSLRVIGRLAYPLFAYSIVMGLMNTKDLRKYYLRLLLIGLISQPVYIIFTNLNWWQFNAILSFSFHLIWIYFLNEALQNKNRRNISLAIMSFISIGALSYLNIPEYGLYGFSLITWIYLIMNQKLIKDTLIKKSIFFVGFYFITLIWPYLSPRRGLLQVFALGSGLIMFNNLIDNKKYSATWFKYFFYLIYPVHMLILYFIRELFIK